MKGYLTSLTIREMKVQTTLRTTSHPWICLLLKTSKKQKITSVWWECGEIVTLCLAGENIKWCSCNGKQDGSSPKY